MFKIAKQKGRKETIQKAFPGTEIGGVLTYVIRKYIAIAKSSYTMVLFYLFYHLIMNRH